MPRSDKLHRRIIRAALMTGRGWVVESRVDGWIDVTVPRAAKSADTFAKEVRLAVEALGYAPIIAIGAGARVVRVRTPETLAQAGRGEHGAAGVVPAASVNVAAAPHPTDIGVDRPESSPLGSDEQSCPAGSSADWMEALRPLSLPYRDRLSAHSPLVMWHIDVRFDALRVTPEQAERWSDPDTDTADTWRKRPLVVGADSGCDYSCGEVELAARFRSAGYEAYWISEWSGFPHVPAWRPFCVKRSELRERLPGVWDYDRALRAQFPQLELGTSGGHPDVVAWRPASRDFVYAEYKGPGDTLKPKQNSWAQALAFLQATNPCYVAVKGRVA